MKFEYQNRKDMTIMWQPTIQDYTKNKLALIVQETTAYELSYSDLHSAYRFALDPHFWLLDLLKRSTVQCLESRM